MKRKKQFLLYLLECIVGVAIGSFLYHKVPEFGGWCLISIIMVLAPDCQEALRFASNRMKANLVGAGVGLATFLIHAPNSVLMGIGVVFAAIVCELLQLKEATRSATVGILMIAMHPPGKNFYDIALLRAEGVLGGCTIAMSLNLITHHLSKKTFIAQS